MTSKTWGLAGETQPEEAPVEPRRKRVALTPQAANAAHKGIVWIHASAIVVWLIVTVTLGALLVAGKHVPTVVVMIGVAAAFGHTLFLATHLALARMAKRRAAAA